MPALASYATKEDLGEYLKDASSTRNAGVWTHLLTRASRYVDTKCNDYFGSLTSQTVVASGAMWPLVFPPYSIQSLTLVETAPYAGATYSSATGAQWVLQPDMPAPNEPYGWLSFVSQAGLSYSADSAGSVKVRLTGTLGWPAVPDPIVHLTLKVAARWWKAMDTGWTGVIGTIDTGIATVKMIDSEDREIISYYRRRLIG